MKRKNRILLIPLIVLGLGLIFINSCTKDDDEIETGTVSDKDGNVYSTVTIGTQVWMAENLAYLPSVSPSSSGSQTSPYYYVYGYEGTSVSSAKATENYSTYGVLYNWQAATSACPDGWHLPTDEEWAELENYLADNGYNYDGTTGGGRDKIAKAMASDHGWIVSSNTGAVGNTDYPDKRNASDFTALPGGYRGYDDFYYVGNYGLWWSATEGDATFAWSHNIGYNGAYVSLGDSGKEGGFSVRCVKN
jgi:uncharacterized protein (TIGR02145 family)